MSSHFIEKLGMSQCTRHATVIFRHKLETLLRICASYLDDNFHAGYKAYNNISDEKERNLLET